MSEEERRLLAGAIPQFSDEEYEHLVAIAQEKISKGQVDNPELDKIVRSLIKYIISKIESKLYVAYRSTERHERLYVSRILSRCVEALIDAVARYQPYYIDKRTSKTVKASFRGWAKLNIIARIDDEIRKIGKPKIVEVPFEEIGVPTEDDGEAEPAEERFIPKGTLEDIRAKSIKFGFYNAIMQSKEFTKEEKQLLEWRAIEQLTLHEISMKVYGNIKNRVIVKRKWDKLKVKIRQYIEKYSGEKFPLIS